MTEVGQKKDRDFEIERTGGVQSLLARLAPRRPSTHNPTSQMKSFPFHCCAAITAVLASLLVAQNALAQAATPAVENDPAVKLSVFEVNTSKDIGYQSMNAAQATRMDTPIEDIPMNVTVFNKQFIDDLLATSSDAVLAYEPSAVKTTENDAFLARGMSSVGTNFLNGFAQTSGGGGSQPLANIERVEVIKGPAAVLYGSGGYGATFNRITKQPLPHSFTSARMILWDQSSYRLEADNGGPLPFAGGKKLLYRVNGVLERSSTYNGLPREEYDFGPSLAWNIGPSTKIVFEYFYNQFNRQGNWEFPVVKGNPNGTFDGAGNFHSYENRKWSFTIPQDLRRTVRQVASYDLRHAFTAKIQFRSQFQFEDNNLLNRETTPDNTSITILKDAVLMPRYWRIVPNHSKNYRSRNELISQFSTGPVAHRLLLGHGYVEQYTETRTDRAVSNNGGLAPTSPVLDGNGRVTGTGTAFNVAPTVSLADFFANPKLAGFNPNLLLPINVFDPADSPAVPAIPLRPALYPNAHTKAFTSSNDFYANDLISVLGERVFVLAGVRRSHTETRTINFLSGSFPFMNELASAPTVSKTANSSTSSYGAVWHLNAAKTFTLYANLNTSFAPTFALQPDGSQLKPEQGRQKEVGLRFNLLGGRIIGLVDYFDILQRNITQADPTRLGYFIQVAGLQSRGEELSLNMRITDWWLAFGGFTYLDSHQVLGTQAPLAQQPKARGTLFNSFSVKKGAFKGFSFSLGTIFTGSRPATSAPANARTAHWIVPPAWQVDTIFNYKFRPAQSRYEYNVGLKIGNVFDNKMVVYSATDIRYSTDPGRNAQVVVGVKF
jgi:iron complex outermembrane receptor protein